MSENEEAPQEVPQEEEKADNITDAIKSVIKKSQANDGKNQRLSSWGFVPDLHEDWWHLDWTLSWTIHFFLGLVKGLNEVCKCLDRKQAILCVLAEDCDDPKYKKLVTVSFSTHSNICKYRPLLKVEISHWLRSSTEMILAHGSVIASTTRKENHERSKELPQSLSRAMVRKLKLSPLFSTISRKSDSTSE